MDAMTPEAARLAVAAKTKPSREEAEAAVRTLISWAGDDPTREGLLDTPKRVVKAYEEWFSGYGADPLKALGKTFEDVQGYDDMVMLTNIDVESHCEHHLAPIMGVAHVAYLPSKAVVGISKIADALTEAMEPRGVAVLVDAKHQCMTTRGVHHPNVSTITTTFTGEFRNDADLKDRFMRLVERA